jgi:hypothetical protein
MYWGEPFCRGLQDALVPYWSLGAGWNAYLLSPNTSHSFIGKSSPVRGAGCIAANGKDRRKQFVQATAVVLFSFAQNVRTLSRK